MAPFAVFHQFYTFGSGLFVLVRTIIAALAFCACKSNSFTHSLHLTQSFSARGQLTCLISISQAQCTSQQKFANLAFKKAGPSQQDYCSIGPETLQIFFTDYLKANGYFKDFILDFDEIRSQLFNWNKETSGYSTRLFTWVLGSRDNSFGFFNLDDTDFSSESESWLRTITELEAVEFRKAMEAVYG